MESCASLRGSCPFVSGWPWVLRVVRGMVAFGTAALLMATHRGAEKIRGGLVGTFHAAVGLGVGHLVAHRACGKAVASMHGRGKNRDLK